MEVTEPDFATLVARAVRERLGWSAQSVQRFATGAAHYVFDVSSPGQPPVVARLGQPYRTEGLAKGTRNVIITPEGTLSGIVDVDDLCFGDPRYAPALTLAALTAMAGPKHYVDYWMRAARHRDDHIFHLCVALFLFDLMSEHGHVFNGNEKPSTPEARAIMLDALAAETAILSRRS